MSGTRLSTESNFVDSPSYSSGYLPKYIVNGACLIDSSYSSDLFNVQYRHSWVYYVDMHTIVGASAFIHKQVWLYAINSLLIMCLGMCL